MKIHILIIAISFFVACETPKQKIAPVNQLSPQQENTGINLRYDFEPTLYLLTFDVDENYGQPPNQYIGFYYEPKSGQYYYAFFEETNGLPITLDDTKIEPLFFNDTNILFYDRLKYVGSLSLLERLYINIKTGQQYLQTLTPIVDTNYVDQTEYKSHRLEEPVYPDFGTNSLTGIRQADYTNKKGDSFFRAINPQYFFRPNEPIPPYLKKGTLMDYSLP